MEYYIVAYIPVYDYGAKLLRMYTCKKTAEKVAWHSNHFAATVEIINSLIYNKIKNNKEEDFMLTHFFDNFTVIKMEISQQTSTLTMDDVYPRR